MSDRIEEPVIPVLLGRARARFAQAVQLFGSVAPTTPYQSSYGTFNGGVQMWDECECGLWMLQCTAIEIQRENDEGSFTPLDPQAFNNVALPVGASRSRRSQIKLRVSAGIEASNRRFDMDSGQTIELNANRVCVDWLAPTGATGFYNVRDITPGVTPPTRGGFVLDVWLIVSLARIEESVGDREVTLTTHIFVPANTQPVVEVPPFATKVTIYQDPTLGAASVAWTMFYGDPNVLVSIPHGTIPFIPGARKTQPDIELPDTTHIQTDADVNDRFYTLRWTIRP